MTRILAVAALAVILIAAIVYNILSREGQAKPIIRTPGARSGGATPQSSSPSVMPTTPERALPSPDTVSAVGIVRAEDQAAITAKVPGRIVTIGVQDGERVVAGQTLVVLDLGELPSQKRGAEAASEAAQAQLRKAEDGKSARKVEMDAQVSQSETGLQNARVKLQQAELGAALQANSGKSDTERARAAVLQAEAGVKQADLALGQAEATLKRLEFLYGRGGVPRAEVEGARTQAEIARSQRESAAAALRQAQAAEKPAVEAGPLRERVSRQDVDAARLGVRQATDAVSSARQARTEALRIADHDVDAARAAVKQADAGEAGIAAHLSGSTLTSPLTGVVTELIAHRGEMAQPGVPLMTVVSTKDLYVEASIPIRYAGRVRPGLAVQLSMETGGPPAQGVVSAVLAGGAGDGRTVPIRIRTRGGTGGLIPGLAVTVHITFPAENK